MGKKVKIVLDIEAHFEGKITFYGRVGAKGTVFFFLQNSMSLLTNSISGNSVFFLSKTHKKNAEKFTRHSKVLTLLPMGFLNENFTLFEF